MKRNACTKSNYSNSLKNMKTDTNFQRMAEKPKVTDATNSPLTFTLISDFFFFLSFSPHLFLAAREQIESY